MLPDRHQCSAKSLSEPADASRFIRSNYMQLGKDEVVRSSVGMKFIKHNCGLHLWLMVFIIGVVGRREVATPVPSAPLVNSVCTNRGGDSICADMVTWGYCARDHLRNYMNYYCCSSCRGKYFISDFMPRPGRRRFRYP